MKTMTARYFAQNASGIGKSLMKNPREVYLVTNLTNPEKNFVCVSVPMFMEIGYPLDVLGIVQAQDGAVDERRKQSSKMSRIYWDNKKEKVTSILDKPVVSDNLKTPEWYKYQHYNPRDKKSDDFGYVHFPSRGKMNEYIRSLL